MCSFKAVFGLKEDFADAKEREMEMEKLTDSTLDVVLHTLGPLHPTSTSEDPNPCSQAVMMFLKKSGA